MEAVNPAVRVAAEQLLAAEPDAAARLRVERRAVTTERQQLERRIARDSGVAERTEQIRLDIEARTSPTVEELRARAAALEARLMQAVSSGASIAKHARVLADRGFNLTGDPIGDPHGVLNRLDDLRAVLTEHGISYVGTDLDVTS